ncbi:MAG: RDD family protein [Pseudomonadota bacterium]
MDWPAPAPTAPLLLPLEEGGQLELHPAGLATRLAARAVDGLCQILLAGACLLLPALILERTAADSQVGATARVGLLALAVLGILASAWLYPVVFELAWRGRTPGKHLLGLQVTDAQGRPPTATAVAVRNLLRRVDLLPGAGLVGLIVAARDPAHRRVGDLVAGTVVVGAWESRAPEVRTPTPR